MLISVAILDQQRFFADGVRALILSLHSEAEFRKVDVNRAPVSSDIPMNTNLVIFDPSTVQVDVQQIITQVRLQASSARILVIASVFTLSTAISCIQNGVHGFVLKSDPVEELQLAIKKVLAGTVYFCPQIQEHQIRSVGSTLTAGLQLTHREREVLRLLLMDQTPKEIAAYLGVSRKTVDAHKRNFFHKLGINSMAGLFQYGIRHGLVKI